MPKATVPQPSHALDEIVESSLWSRSVILDFAENAPQAK